MIIHIVEIIIIIAWGSASYILLSEKINSVHNQNKKIMATIQEALSKIDELKDKFDAYKQVVTDEFAALKAQIAAGSAATPEQLDEIIAKAQAAEDDIASAPTAPIEG